MVMRGGRHVHFNDENTYHTYSPAPSSCSSSPSPSTSMLLPRQPPTPEYYHSHVVPLPVASPDVSFRNWPKVDGPSQFYCSTPASVHPSVALPPSGAPHLSWAILYDFHSAVDRSEPRQQTGGLSKTLLAQPATEPPAFSLTVRVVDPSHPYPWDITVTPQTSATYVTVEDVLHAVHRNVRTHVKQLEYADTEKRSREASKRIAEAFYARCAHAPSPEAEKAKGMRRVDYLCGKHIFAGLAVVGRGQVNTLGELEGVVLEMRVSRS